MNLSNIYRQIICVVGTLVLIFSVLLQSCKLEEIPPLPTVEFTVLCGTVTDGGDSCLMVFTNTSLYGDSYLWNFGDGTTSTSRVPQGKKLLNNCSYTITLKVGNQTGDAEHTQGVTIGTATPVAAFSTLGYPIAACGDNEVNCLGEPFNTMVAFVNESSCAYRYEWTVEMEGGGDDELVGFEPVYEWCDSAIYNVTLVAYGQDEFGNEIASDPFSDEVQVYGTSSVTCTMASFDSPHTCETQGVGCSLLLTNTSSNAESSLWQIYRTDSPNILYASSEEESPSIFFEGSTSAQVDYDVYLTSFGVFNDDVAYEKVHIIPDGSTSAIFHLDRTNVNLGHSVTIEESSINAESWTWSINDEQFATGLLPENWDTAFYEPGFYTFSLQVTGSGEQSPDWLIEETVNVIPGNDFWECGNPWYDDRDEKLYNTTNINGTCFFAECLDYDVADLDYVGTGDDSCIPGLRYYHWDTAVDACPDGWSIPTEEQISATFGLYSSPSPSPTDLAPGGSTGFNTQYGGVSDGIFCSDGGFSAVFWARATNSTPRFWAWDDGSSIYWYESDTELTFPWNANVMLNIRCVKDQ
jgi:uncharacterized protein (TIGR02145 family)